MAYLVIESGHSGLTARMLNPQTREETDRCLVLYEDLPESEISVFEAAMAAVSNRMDTSQCREAVVILPPDLFFFRTMGFPFKSKAKIRQVLPLDLSAKLPAADTGIVHDFQIAGWEPAAGDCPVLCAAIPETVFDTFILGLESSGLAPSVLAPAGPALAAVYAQTQKTVSDFIFIDLAEGLVSITIVVNRLPAHVRVILCGEGPAQDLAGSLSNTLTGFRQRTGVDHTFDLVAAGDNLQLIFEAEIQGDSFWEKTGIHPEILSADRDALLLQVWPGRNIPGLFNLCRDRYPRNEFLKRYGRSLVSSTVLALTVFILFMAGFYTAISGLKTEVAQKEQIVADIFKETFPDKKTHGMDPLLLMQASVKEATRGGTGRDADPGINTRGIQAGKTILELSRRIPAKVDLEITRLMLDGDRMMLDGSSDNFNTIDQAKGLIEASPLFGKVEITSAVASKRDQRVEFKFMVEIKNG